MKVILVLTIATLIVSCGPWDGGPSRGNLSDMCRLSSDPDLGLVLALSKESTPPSTQDIDVCEKIKKLVYKSRKLNIVITQMRVFERDKRFPSCMKLEWTPNVQLDSIGYGHAYRSIINELAFDKKCLQEVIDTSKYAERVHNREVELDPQASIRAVANFIRDDPLPYLRDSSGVFVIPLYMVGDSKTVEINCLAIVEMPDAVLVSANITKYDCLSRL